MHKEGHAAVKVKEKNQIYIYCIGGGSFKELATWGFGTLIFKYTIEENFSKILLLQNYKKIFFTEINSFPYPVKILAFSSNYILGKRHIQNIYY